MNALTALRSHLMADTALKLDPANLKTFVENGTVYTGPGNAIYGGKDANKDFRLNYEGVIFVDKVSLDPRYLCWVIGEWMNSHQLDRQAGDIKFEADILSHKEVVYEFRLKLQEDVKVTEAETGTTLASCYGPKPCPHLGVTIAEEPRPNVMQADVLHVG